MDARPFRPRGSENAVPSLHQRHKSTGTLSNMASTATTVGFRGPAKRAAFGDVTNMAKNVGGAREDAKLVKVRSVAHFGQQQHQPLVNKENASNQRELLARPAQRAVLQASKPKPASLDLRPTALPVKQEQVLIPELVEEPVSIALGSVEDLYPAERQQKAAQETAAAAPSTQPRHYKSQQQLKQQQPTLRRTQSRQFERTDFNKHQTRASYPGGEPLGLPNTAVSRVGFDDARLAPVLDHADYDELINMAREQTIDLPSKLPEISEEPAYASATFKDGTTPGLSEPEEYWDEDDDDYDDQDQAYTTAHSFGSRDMTTGAVTVVLQPRMTARVQRELEEAKQEVAETRLQEDIEDEAWDVSMVAEYGEEIFEYMRELELKMLPDPNYMVNQTEIQWSMRSVLMDWLVQVHTRFCLLPETLFLTVNYIDRFLSVKVVSIGKLQLVGATAILVASKYEEINCPSLDEVVYMVDYGYGAEEVLKAERYMLSMLGFELGWPGPMSFLRRVSKADDYDLDTRTLAKYFLELTIMDERFVASPPSFLAAGAHCLSRLILNKGEWTKAHVHYSGYTWGQLKSLVSLMIGCCEKPELHHGAVFEKYSKDRFKRAATIVQEALDAGFTLPKHSQPVRPARARSIYFDDVSDQLRYQNAHLVPTES